MEGGEDLEDVEGGEGGSGVWERAENRRWMVVRGGRHRIPGRAHCRSEGSGVDPSLGISSYLAAFELEVAQQPGSFQLVSDGESLVRLQASPHAQEEDQQQEVEEEAGPSSAQSSSSVETRSMRRSSETGEESREVGRSEVVTQNEEVGTSPARRRNRRRMERRKARRKWQLGRRQEAGRRQERCTVPSVESSPGRDSPSPDSLRRIIQGRPFLSDWPRSLPEHSVE